MPPTVFALARTTHFVLTPEAFPCRTLACESFAAEAFATKAFTAVKANFPSPTIEAVREEVSRVGSAEH
jgi:hypothetical protein